MTQTNNPYTFYVPDKYDPGHFMPWVHPFTRVIGGPTGSGKSVFVRRFVHHIKYQTHDDPNTGSHLVVLWRVPDFIRNSRWGGLSTRIAYLDTLDPRDKHLLILDDLMDETNQRVASLITKKSHHRNISVMYIVQNLFHRGKHHQTIVSMPITWFYSKTRKTYRIKCIPGERNFS